MTTEKIIKDATQNKEIRDYSLLDIHLYLIIQQILKMYFNNQISKEEANKYKQIAVNKYQEEYKQYDFEREMFQEHIKNIRDTETQRIKLRKILKDDEVTEERLCEIISTCMEIISTVFKGEF